MRRISGWLRSPEGRTNGAALLAAVLGAIVFSLLGLPLPLILGALVGSAISANVVGIASKAKSLRRMGQLIIGAAIAGILTTDAALMLVYSFPAMLAAALALNAFGIVLSFPIAWIAGVDRWTAILSCLPGGMAEMSSLARELGGQEAVVAIIQALRVVLLVALIPVWLGEDLPEAPPPEALAGPGAALILAVFVAISAGLALASRRIGLMNPWVVVPMILGFLVTAAGADVPEMPTPVVAAAQIAVGAALGARFDVTSLRALPRAALAGVVSAVLLAGFAFAFLAPALAMALDLPELEAMLASAPGGIGEMIAAATALGLISASIAGFQFTRSLVTNAVVPPLVRAAIRRLG